MKKNKYLLQVHTKDNVAVVLQDLTKSQVVEFFGKEIIIDENASVGDRIILDNIAANEPIYQYNSKFCYCKDTMKIGDIVSRNKVLDYKNDIEKIDIGKIDIEINQNIIDGFKEKYADTTFKGYKRSENSIGTRNYYVLIPTSFCATDMATRLSLYFDHDSQLSLYPNIDGVVAAGHTEGCGCSNGDIINRLLKIIKNTISHPNCGGALIVDLGCEKTNYNVMNKYLGNLSEFNKPIDFITIQELGGTVKSFDKGKEIISSRLKEVNNITREDCSLKNLILGTECGASDSFSGITANPLIGSISDNIVDLKGKVILSETPEMLGAEEILLSRMPSIQTREKFIKGVLYYKNMASSLNVNMSGNLVAGNLKGGLINLTLKSLGSIQKGGSREIVDFVDYGSKVEKSGLTIMNGPGNDFESVTGITASGANVFLFSTGLGTTEGSLISPIIKVASNSNMFNRLPDDMDFDAGKVLEEGLNAISDKLFTYLLQVVSGEVKTSSERHKKRAFQIWSAGKLSL